VVSRRARGVSVGINLNPNNACNWRCVYCQVPGLVFGNAPAIDLALLERELAEQLVEVQTAGWLEAHAPEGSRRINDVALSGNGEPTSSRQLPEVLEVIARTLEAQSLLHRIKVILITNGSLIALEHVQQSIRRLAQLSGEVWFKLDSATDAGLEAVNNAHIGALRQRRNLELCASLCPTWIQSCFLRIDGRAPSSEERGAYLLQVKDLVAAKVPLRGVHLYTIARTSHQPEAPRLSALEPAWLAEFAGEIRAAGLPVEIAP
jgi:wyosine [tRNA(Phe)-imidazoG37] synthetase (radical SAM superfamily)